MQSQAGNNQSKLEVTVRNLANVSEELDSSKIQQVAQTAQKCSSMMQTYLGQDPFFRSNRIPVSPEGGEVTHYEVLTAISKKLNKKIKNNGKLSTTVNSILREEKRHLALCIKLAKQTATK